MERKFTLWKLQDGQFRARDVVSPIRLTDDLPRGGIDIANDLFLCPVPSEGNYIAAMLVPRHADHNVAYNRTPLPAGVTLLRHADRIDVDDSQYWVAASREPEFTEYDAQRHGDDIRCFITKAPLRAGDEIVRCPGVPGQRCEIIYKLASWEAVLEADPRFICPQCGFDPSAPQWQPTLPTKSSLKRILEMAHRE